MTELQLFAARALRRLPLALWWVLALLAGAIFSIQLEKELFPNTPAVVRIASWLWKACMAALPALGVLWLWRVAWLVEHPGWRLLWYVGATGAAVLLFLLLLLLLVGVGVLTLF